MNISYQLETKHQKSLQKLAERFTAIYVILEKLNGPEYKEKKEYIKKCSLISNIGASTRIENAILTDREIEWIDTEIGKNQQQSFSIEERSIKNKLSKDKEKSIEEVAGYREAINIIFDMEDHLFPLRESDIKGLHRELLKYYPKANHYLGDYKTLSNSVVEKNYDMGEELTIFQTAKPGLETSESMSVLLDWYNSTLEEDLWKIPVAIEFVFRFLAIHPFQDGNGRLSRLLFHLVMLSSGVDYYKDVIPYVGLDRCIEQTRSKYYRVLRRCSQGEFRQDPRGYNYIPFLEYMIEMLEKSADNITYYLDKYERYKDLSETALKILNFFKEEPEICLQTKDIVAQLEIPRRTVIYSLNSLVENKFIQSFGAGRGRRYKLTF